MERNREGRRSGTTAVGTVTPVTRRPRAKEISDDEDRMDETVDTRLWDRTKKERLASLHVSSNANARNKRKRQLLPQDSQASGVRPNAVVDDADESIEETEAQLSEDDDEPPPPPFMRRPGPGKARVHSKEDDILMDIPAVPRKARSSMSASSRYSSMARRQLESHHNEFPRQKPAAPSQTTLNGGSSPNFLQKQGRKLKPAAPKIQAMKVPKVAEVSTLSDKEAEVAEVLFDLSRSLPSHSNVLESKSELEVRIGSSPTGHTPSIMGSTHGLHHSISTANGYVASLHLNASPAEASKRKRPQVVSKSEEGKTSVPVRLASLVASLSASPSRPHQSCVGETELCSLSDKVQVDQASLPSDSLSVKSTTDAAVSEIKAHDLCENEGMEKGVFIPPKQDQQSAAEVKEAVIDRSIRGAGTADLQGANDSNSTNELVNRSVEALCEDGSTATLNIDLMASPLNHIAMEEPASGSTTDRQNGRDNSLIVSAGHGGQNHAEEHAKENFVLEGGAKAMDVARELSMIKGKVDGIKQELNDDGERQVHDRSQMVQAAPQSGREEEEQEKEMSVKALSKPQDEVLDTTVTVPFVSSAMLAAAGTSNPVPLSGWIGGLPHLGYYGPGAPPWAAGASLTNPSIDVKAAHSAMPLSPVQRMKRCATHVVIAHFIYRDQQISRQSLWSAALCRAPYNLNIPPVNILENEKVSGHYLEAARKASAQQSGPSYGYTLAQGVGPGMVGSSIPGVNGMIPGSNHVSSTGMSGDTSNTNVSGTSSNVMTAHAQYLQAMMHNGFPSFPFPFSGPHSQAASFLNGPFFPPHLMHPPIPQVQAIAQQSGNVLKQQQGVGSLPHSSSQLVAPPLQQQLQLQLAPQSPSQSQQPHNSVGMPAQQFGIHSEKEISAVLESASTAESRLSAIQMSINTQQGHSNLPSFNINASPLMLGTSLSGISSHDQDGPSLVPPGSKNIGKGHTQFSGHNSALLSSSMQSQQFTSGSASGFQMKVLDTTSSQGYSTLTKNAVNSGTLGLVSSMMGTPSLAVLPGSLDGSKVSRQQQPVYGGQGQHFQRSMTKGPVSDEAYAIKARDYLDDKKNSMRPVGAPALISRVDMEVSSPPLQGSPTSGSSASNGRVAGAIGRTLNSGTPSDVRSSRPASSTGSGQRPLLQNQPLPKQAMGHAKTVSGIANVAATPIGSYPVASYGERVMPGNFGKFPGTAATYSSHVATSSQNSKPVHTGMTKVGQRMSPGPTHQLTPGMTKNIVQQARGNESGVPSNPRMPHSVTSPVLPGGAISMSTSQSLSSSKALNVGTSKSPLNGKGSVSVAKAGPPSKKPPVSGSAISSGLSPMQHNMSRASAQSRVSSSAVHAPQFHQQQSAISAQQQRLPTSKNQVYPQLQAQQGQYKQPFQAQSTYRPQYFLQQHQQQYLQQQPPQQQQVVPQHQQTSVSQIYPPNPQSSQHSQAQGSQPISHLQQQLQPLMGSNGLPLHSPNLNLGTAVSGNITSCASLDGVGLKTNPTKMGYGSASPLSTGGIPEMIAAAHSTVAGQGSSPLIGSSSHLHLAAVKSSEQKPLVSEAASREDVAGARHLSLPSSSQAAVTSNPSSS